MFWLCFHNLNIAILQFNHHPWHAWQWLFILLPISPTTYVMEEDEPTFLEAIDYSAESDNEDGEPENEHGNNVHENPDHLDQLSDSY